jgi:predicted lipoprotein with Yx(FWY)xxD motif
MAIHRTSHLRLFVTALVTLALAGCATAAPGTTATTPPAPGAASLMLSLSTLPGGGQYITDNAGRAVYQFQTDTRSRSTCTTAACVAAWPPVPGGATLGTGLILPLTTLTRDDGSTQSVYNGHPLYYFKSDTKSGDIKGEGLNTGGAPWYLVDAAGNPITSLSGAASSGVPSGPGGGY